MSDRIEEHRIEGPVSGVAGADGSCQLGTFRGRLEGPFVPGHIVRAQSTYPGHE
jgi:hypothetical protein